MSISDLAEEVWYEEHSLSYVLTPVSWLYQGFMFLRNIVYRSGLIPIHRMDVPVIVIGNITVGGTGKTPLTIWMAQYLKSKGFTPGIVSRGYGGELSDKIQQVRADSNPILVGDEPVVIARNTKTPVAVGKNRYLAAQGLLEHQNVDVIICDDGLQHLRLGRDIEIAVVDGDRRFGNGKCLPAGPLREPQGRLKNVDFIVCNGKTERGEHLMEYTAGKLRSVKNPDIERDIEVFDGQMVHAVSGVGNPARFHSYLRSHEMQLIKEEFSDHHKYTASDLNYGDEFPIVMTEKDAVKCEEFATDDMWYLPISAQMANTFIHRLDKRLKEIGIG